MDQSRRLAGPWSLSVGLRRWLIIRRRAWSACQVVLVIVEHFALALGQEQCRKLTAPWWFLRIAGAFGCGIKEELTRP